MPLIKKIDSFYEKLHDKLPAVGKAASFLTGTGILTANSALVGLPVWTMGAAKVLTGSKLTDDAEDFAWWNMKVDAPQGVDGAILSFVGLDNASEFDHATRKYLAPPVLRKAVMLRVFLNYPKE